MAMTEDHHGLDAAAETSSLMPWATMKILYNQLGLQWRKTKCFKIIKEMIITRKEKGAEFRAWNSQVTFSWVSTLCFFSKAPWAFKVYPSSEVLSCNWGRLVWSEENHTSQPWDAGTQVVARFNIPPCPTAGRRPHVSSYICTPSPKSLPGPQSFR